MRRPLLVFLMLLMSFQFAWGAAASVCAHEQIKASERHFGHHDPHHEKAATSAAYEAAGDAQALDPGLANTLDADHHALNIHPVPHISLLALPVARFRMDCPERFDPYPSALIASLERPPKAAAESLRQGF